MHDVRERGGIVTWPARFVMRDDHVHHAAGQRYETDLSAEAVAEDCALKRLWGAHRRPPCNAAAASGDVLLPEEVTSDTRIDPIETNHEIISTRRAIAELHRHAGGILINVDGSR